jgi:hypothetical protein
MKKLLGLVLGLALLGMAAASFGATSLTFNIGITVRATTVDIATNAAANILDWGILSANTSYSSAYGAPNTYTANAPVYQVVNVGSVNIDLSLQETTAAAGWTVLETGAPGAARVAAEYRLFGAFTGYFPAQPVSMYGAEDIIKASAATPANNVVGGVYALTGEGGTGGVGAYLGGVNIIPEIGVPGPTRYQGTRSIQFAVDTPVTVDGSTKSIGITVSAVAH